MFFAPVIGPVFFVAGELARHLLFGQSADLEDVIFSKERVRTHFMADEEQERNVVPIEEALAISDRDSLRTLIMNVVGETSRTLSDRWRWHLTVRIPRPPTMRRRCFGMCSMISGSMPRSFTGRCKRTAGEAGDDACLLIEYMYVVLKQNVFHETEQRTFVDMFEEACELLYEKDYRKAHGAIHRMAV